MITMKNFREVEKALPVLGYQVDTKATGATIHRLKTHQAELHGAMWGLRHTTKHEYYLSLANRARKSLESFGIFITV